MTEVYNVEINNKIMIKDTFDKPYREDDLKHNPEGFLLTTVASRHMLLHLHLCADAGVIVLNYKDNPTGILTQNEKLLKQFENQKWRLKIKICLK